MQGIYDGSVDGADIGARATVASVAACLTALWTFAACELQHIRHILEFGASTLLRLSFEFESLTIVFFFFVCSTSLPIARRSH